MPIRSTEIQRHTGFRSITSFSLESHNVLSPLPAAATRSLPRPPPQDDSDRSMQQPILSICTPALAPPPLSSIESSSALIRHKRAHATAGAASPGASLERVGAQPRPKPAPAGRTSSPPPGSPATSRRRSSSARPLRATTPRPKPAQRPTRRVRVRPQRVSGRVAARLRASSSTAWPRSTA